MFPSFVCVLPMLSTYFEHFVWRCCWVNYCSVPKASLVAVPSKPSPKKVWQDTLIEVCRAFLFLCSLSLAAITSPTDTVGEVIRVPDVALAKTSFLCLPLFLASAWCLLWVLRVGAIFLVASRKAENKNQNLISILSESDRIEIRFWFLLESFYFTVVIEKWQGSETEPQENRLLYTGVLAQEN